ncbi:MAG: hypothetical protein R2757_03440 [Draconibacterium sp.]
MELIEPLYYKDFNPTYKMTIDEKEKNEIVLDLTNQNYLNCHFDDAGREISFKVGDFSPPTADSK